MTGAPESRKTHVIRILGTNRNGDILPNIWADVERIDRSKYVTQTKDTDYQGVVRNFRWLDDPDSADGVVEPRTRDGVLVNPDATRDVITVKLCSPDETNLSDPEEWIPIDAIKRVRAKDSGQGKVDAHINEQLTDARIVRKRRVFHRDTTIDVLAQAAFDADPARKAYVVSGDRYSFIEHTDDKEQYVEHEVITSLKGRANDQTGTGAGSDQGLRIGLLNQYIIDQTDPAKLKEVGLNGLNPPYRLDPYQNIVNVQLGSYDNRVVLAVDEPPDVVVSTDGWNWRRLGELAYGGDPDHNLSFINLSGWRRDIKRFAISGTRITFDGINFHNEDIGMISEDGIHWSRNGGLVDPDLLYAYAKKSRRVVNGHVYRVAKGPRLNNTDPIWSKVDDTRYLTPKFARIVGTAIQRCANTAAKEDDDGENWETVLETDASYLAFGPIAVIKGDGLDSDGKPNVPTLICRVDLNSELFGPQLTKDGILSSRDGMHFTLTFKDSVPDGYTGSMFGLCTGRAEAAP